MAKFAVSGHPGHPGLAPKAVDLLAVATADEGGTVVWALAHFCQFHPHIDLSGERSAIPRGRFNIFPKLRYSGFGVRVLSNAARHSVDLG